MIVQTVTLLKVVLCIVPIVLGKLERIKPRECVDENYIKIGGSAGHVEILFDTDANIDYEAHPWVPLQTRREYEWVFTFTPNATTSYPATATISLEGTSATGRGDFPLNVTTTPMRLQRGLELKTSIKFILYSPHLEMCSAPKSSCKLEGRITDEGGNIIVCREEQVRVFRGATVPPKRFDYVDDFSNRNIPQVPHSRPSTQQQSMNMNPLSSYTAYKV